MRKISSPEPCLVIINLDFNLLGYTPEPSEKTMTQFRKITLVLALSASSMAVSAQTGVPAVNPFTGNVTSIENSKKELEVLKLRTQMIEEQLKQKVLELEQQNLPIKKEAEILPAKVQIQTLEKKQSSEREAAQRQKREEAANVARLKRMEQQAKEESEKPKFAPAPQVTLRSVIESGNMKQAIFDINGGMQVYANGDLSPFGPVQILSSNAVSLGGKGYQIQGMNLSKIRTVDHAPEPAESARTQAPRQTSAATQNPSSLPTPPGLPPVMDVNPETLRALGLSAR